MTITSAPFKIKITTVDAEPPTVNISQPQLGGVVVLPPGQPLVVSGTASDIKSGVDYTEVLIDSGGYQRATGTTSWTISFSGVPPGIHTVRARSRDKAGNYSAENVTGFTVQNIILPPPPPPPPVGPPPPPPPPIPPNADYLLTQEGSLIVSKNVRTGGITSNTYATPLIQSNWDNQGVTIVGSGSFPMNGYVITDKPFTLLGQGDSTIFRPTIKTNLFLVENAANFEIGKFQIAGIPMPTPTGSYAIRLRGAVKNGKVHDYYCHDFGGYGLIAGDSPTSSFGMPSDLTLSNLRLFDNIEVALGLAGRNITATNIKTRAPAPIGGVPTEVAQISIEVDHAHYVMDNITVDGFEVDRGKRIVFMGGRAINDNTVNPANLKNITIKNGTISNSWYKGLDLIGPFWQNVKVENVTLNNNVVGLRTKIPGVQWSNIKFGVGPLANGTNMISEGGNLP